MSRKTTRETDLDLSSSFRVSLDDTEEEDENSSEIKSPSEKHKSEEKAENKTKTNTQRSTSSKEMGTLHDHQGKGDDKQSVKSEPSSDGSESQDHTNFKILMTA